MKETENPGYDIGGMAMLELIWGKGFIAPGAEGNVDRIVEGVDLAGKLVLELGSGIGGGAIRLGKNHGARVIGLEIEGPLVKQATENALAAGLADKVEFRWVDPGDFPISDDSIDFFYTSGVLLHFEDKLPAFSEAYRVLKPGGVILGYDWLAGPPATTNNMKQWAEAAGLSAYPESLGAYTGYMREAGFENISSSDASDWYLARATDEFEQMTGPLFDRMATLGDAERRDAFIDEWRKMLVVLNSGELKSGYFRGRKL
jgi:ubiquinone/menaquinone biosynthesis C-methylase UbiE